MRLSRTIAIALCSLLLLPGCRSDYKDIDRRQFIVAIGLDKGEAGKFGMTLRGAIPQSQSPGSATSANTFDIYNTSAASIGQAVQQAAQQFFLEPDYSHLKAVVFSEQLAREDNILKFVDFFIRRRDFQDIAEVAVAADAADIVGLHQKGERTSSDNLFMKFGEGVNTEYTPTIELQQIYKYSITPGLTFFCPLLGVERGKIVSAGTALFDRNNRMVQKLNRRETKYFNLLRTGLDRGYIALGAEEQFGVGIKHGTATFRFTPRRIGLLCDVHVRMEAIVEDSDLTDYSIADLQRMAKEKLDGDLADLLGKMQNNGTDPLFLGLKYWSVRPDFKLDGDWLTELYPEIEFHVHSDVTVTRTGTLRWSRNQGLAD